MFEAAVEVGIAAFLVFREAQDDEVQAALEKTGVEPWLAQRLVVYLPVAFGRRLLTGATLSDLVDDGGTLRPLADDPVYVAAQERVERAVREEVSVISVRSSEVSAANQALRAGSKVEDMVFSPLALVRPLAPAGSGHGGVPSPRDAFADLLAGHGFPVEAPLSINARMFPRIQERSVGVQVDFAIAHPSLAVPILLESFAGWGSTWRVAVGQALEKFECSSLHPLIAGLLDRGACHDQVQWERLEHPGGPFGVVFSGQLVLYAREPVPNLGPLVDSMKKALRKVTLSRAVHALRIYVCWNKDELVSREALLDNEPWAEGEEIVTGYAWPRPEGMWGSRLFLVLVPAE
jgi:hypothetical protein